FRLPRPMLHSGDLNFSFSGLKTAVLTLVNQNKNAEGNVAAQTRADICLAFQEAIVEVLVTKSLAALKQTGHEQLVVAGGVGANRQLRESLTSRAQQIGCHVFYPPLEFCTDNGAMIAFAGALRLQKMGLEGLKTDGSFSVRPRWDLAELD
ncbi:MAG: tRNA (adenosine(37)-N6)-threonylcarbamoyltransferase complex transferase subunit TsaD, partial [Burkholderiales bacterium]